jgi:uncharacterized protein RhaS with RHS repeats
MKLKFTDKKVPMKIFNFGKKSGDDFSEKLDKVEANRTSAPDLPKSQVSKSSDDSDSIDRKDSGKIKSYDTNTVTPNLAVEEATKRAEQEGKNKTAIASEKIKEVANLIGKKKFKEAAFVKVIGK